MWLLCRSWDMKEFPPCCFSFSNFVIIIDSTILAYCSNFDRSSACIHDVISLIYLIQCICRLLSCYMLRYMLFKNFKCEFIL